MSDLDQVSLHIGQLSGQVESLNKNMDHLVSWIKDSNGRIETALTTHATEDKKSFDLLTEKVAKLEKFRAKALAVVSVCTLVLTGGWNFLIAHLTHTNG